MNPNFARFAFPNALLAAAVGIACSADDAAPAADTAPAVDSVTPTDTVADGGDDATEPEDIADLEDAPVDGDDTADTEDPPDTGPATPTTGARAFVIASESEIVPGDYVQARPGDVVIQNDHVRFVIHAGPESLYLTGLGPGLIVDAGPADDPSVDLLQETIPIAGFNSFGEGTVEVTSNGHDGTAVVTVKSKPRQVPLVAEYVGELPIQGNIEQRYRLGPDDRAVEMLLDVEGPGEVVLGELAFFGGPAVINDPEGIGFLAAEGPKVSYALVSETDVTLTEIDALILLLGPTVETPLSWRRWLAIGDGSLSSVTDQALVLRGESTVAVSGVIDGGTAAAGLSVTVRDSDDVVMTRFRAGVDSTFSGLVPPGFYSLRVEGPGRAPGAPVDVDAVFGAPVDDLALSASPAGKLIITLDMPMRLDVETPGGGSRVVPLPPGTTEVPVPPGDYSLIASRGFEWEIATTNVTVAADGSATWAPTLVRSVDTTGWVASEFHIHSEWSTDSGVPLRDRVLSCAAEGIEYVVATDHDVVTDYGPFLLPSLNGFLQVASGVETSTAKFGHINSWPWVLDKDKGGRGAPRWFGLDFPEIMQAVKAGTPGHVVQINHPRDGISANFDRIGLNPKKPLDPTLKASLIFNAVEIFNAGDLDLFTEGLADWLYLVENGLPIAATGTSDGHSIESLCGHPRTLVAVDNDDPATLKPTDADAGVLAQKTLVTSGPFVTLTPGASAGTVHLKVAAPSWMPAETWELWVDSKLDATGSIEPYDGNVVRLDSDVAVINTAGKRVVAIVRAQARPKPLKKAVLAVTPVLKL